MVRYGQTDGFRRIRINGMLADLEFAYSPVREKVRDLREYL